jgi:segregation and condensation protein A
VDQVEQANSGEARGADQAAETAAATSAGAVAIIDVPVDAPVDTSHDVSADVPDDADPDAAADPAAAAADTSPAFSTAFSSASARGSSRNAAFEVHLDEFSGPFDLLLGLIAKHKLDVTILALSKITDEFIAYIRAMGADWDLDQASDFLLVAATLLDLKAARLLPAAEVEDEEDLALLEARDLLFARLLQYRAYKQVAAELAERYANGLLRYPRSVQMEPAFRDLLPEVLLNLTPEKFAALAVRAMTPRIPPTVSITHIHQIQVSIREQAAIIVERMRVLRTTTFRVLIEDAPDTLHVVARFLALLELFRDQAVGFDQEDSFAELTVYWTGSENGAIRVVEEFNGAPAKDQDDE